MGRARTGYPLADTLQHPRNGGCGQHVECGSVYWTPARAALDVDRRLPWAWAAQGWERDPLGYPVGPATTEGGVLRQVFQGGTLTAR